MKTILCGVAVLAALVSGCAFTSYGPPVRSELADIPLPEGLQYLPDQSVVIESETIRAARLVYKSRYEPASVVLSIQAGLEQKGWRLVRSTTFPKEGTLELYEKGEASLQVRVWEGSTFSAATYVELSGSRLTLGGKPAVSLTR